VRTGHGGSDGARSDVLIVSLGATGGLRAADRELAASLERAGARVALVSPPARGDVRTLALTDFGWAVAARRRARDALQRAPAGTVLYSSVTAALLWPRPGAIRFDAPAAANRPGRHGLWQRPLERRRLAAARLLVPWRAAALEEAGVADGRERAVVVPVPVEPSGPPAPERDVAAVTYAANPEKKGLDRVLDAWRRARRGTEELVVAGADLDLREEGIRVVGRLSPEAYRALLRRARVFVCAPRREDHGLTQLEALADGCLLVTTVAPGPYVALPLARRLDPRLIGEDLVGALRAALDDPPADYAERALRALEPFRRAAIDRVVRDELLPRLLAPGAA
jgi:glycosyltransferase involved in cell wall biosynthesis